MIETRLATEYDIPGVLVLQDDNLYKNLTPSERERGFVTTPFTIPQLKTIIQKNGLFIAENKNSEIIAYAFAGDWKYFQQWEIFNFMVARFPQLSFQGKKITTQNSFQYGPVCISLSYRGKGILNLIFEEMRIAFEQNFPISITFINQVNLVSKKAHIKKLGWEVIDEFEFNGNSYISLAFDMKKTVLQK